MQPVNRMCQGGLLVVHRDHHVEHGHAGRAVTERRSAVRSKWWSRTMSVMTSIVEPPRVSLVGPSCAPAMSSAAPR